MSRVHDALTRVQGNNGGTQGTPPPEQSGVPLFPLEGQDAAGSWVSEGPPPVVAAQPESTRTATGVLEDEPVRRLGEKLVAAPDPDHASVEQYRRLAARLHLSQAEHGIKVVMIASALPGEGKTLTASNLALTLSESYHRDVLLIDGDLRRPSVHEMFRIQNVSGLNDGLRSDSDRKVPLMRWSDHLTLVTAGRPEPDPMKVLVSDKMRRVIAEASEKFEWIIIDTPPVGLLTDASLLSAMVDTVVLVVQAGRTPYAEIQRAVEVLDRDRIFGVVLNRVPADRSSGYYGYPYQYIRAPRSN